MFKDLSNVEQNIEIALDLSKDIKHKIHLVAHVQDISLR